VRPPPGAANNALVQRISVVGNSGSGKTTLAARLAAALGVPHLELDSVFHLPGWQPRPAEEFRAIVSGFTAGDAWVVDGNYSKVRDLIWQRADTVIWLDLSRPVIMRQLLRRTLSRMARRTELWNGNRESFANLFRLDPAESILRWAWTQHGRYRDRYASASADPANAHLEFVRLASRADAADFARQAGAGR
jgi:adenylate kinase family enzyme